MRLRRLALVFTSLSLIASAAVGISVATAAGNPNCNAIEGDYIVSFANGVNVDREIKGAPGRGISAKYRYSNALNGFAALLSAEQVCAFQKRPNVENIELDGTVTSQAVQTPATWGLDRIDQPNKIISTVPESSTYDYTSTGTGVTVYVIDSGIQLTHPDFSPAAVKGFDAFGGTAEDCNGHGTHVAGTIGGTKYGVAKDVNLVSVKVLDCKGSGSTSGVIAGVNHVILNKVPLSVANMSLGGGASTALDTAVSNLIKSGVTVVVAAGNSRSDACRTSPARVASAITVAASDKSDIFASFSNQGACVDLIAPGVAIESTWINGGINTISGTSMAAPHVAGAVARYLSKQSNASQLLGDTKLGVIKSVPAKTTSKFLFVDPTK